VNPDRQELVRAYWILLFSFLILILIAGSSFFLSKSSLALLEVFLLLPLIIHVRRMKLSFFQSVRWKTVSLKIGILSVLIGLGTAVCVDEMNRLMQMAMPMNELIRRMNETLIWHSLPEAVCLFIGGAIVAAMTEEFLFRGFFQRIMERDQGPTKSVMITALLFALFHVQPFIAELVTYGLILGILCWRTDSVIPPMIAHAAINSAALLFANWTPEKVLRYELGGHVAPVWILAGLIMTVGGMTEVFRISKNKG
jgi:membrane protease YdiL (CAAX protease family)